ncbi:hypothetical protein QBA57_26615 [Streptomyces scabiei]|uniref:hypothetical protein n=1 Tax=Streptomyces scabiei TaxID=1930 RepID=UPI001B3124FD|nr:MULTISPECIES: hypothetical protein [Streptomyces]MBP5875814.1 hypothetical protein [Streptomyces sp. LBUM 1477]MBP5883530.1 hypothetical protein [Streptomyces sp. LBUM 1487]MBP5899559.1 hypothetical protein [Streptomyces sp. LBUM 1488]MDW8473040.1 hypothetical protein [Streptomyces scabiei]MDX2570913.1 hypothetical protein [Streptomyces scabiei]
MLVLPLEASQSLKYTAEYCESAQRRDSNPTGASVMELRQLACADGASASIMAETAPAAVATFCFFDMLANMKRTPMVKDATF